jgi:hypothetical protein
MMLPPRTGVRFRRAAVVAVLGVILSSAASAGEQSQWSLGGFKDVALLAFGTPAELSADVHAFAFICGTGGASLVLRTNDTTDRRGIPVIISTGNLRLHIDGASVVRSEPSRRGAVLTAKMPLEKMTAIMMETGDLLVWAERRRFLFPRTGLDLHSARFIALCQKLSAKGERMRALE